MCTGCNRWLSVKCQRRVSGPKEGRGKGTMKGHTGTDVIPQITFVDDWPCRLCTEAMSLKIAWGKDPHLVLPPIFTRCYIVRKWHFMTLESNLVKAPVKEMTKVYCTLLMNHLQTAHSKWTSSKKCCTYNI